ncbi:pyruvate, phosphate dikinase [Rhodococcoides kyotonense]|uniref:Pyruvate, orthophosphate dikinase n=1 Tax=Rhodococcoides kyotonense TaxID=398843 RepID=A0A239K5D4_9NOCA|nr:pyruvate, phosphate dikinase [Rhodococcus kyotonensis]SNT12829.1 pyruvate, orthophosphate dikinase [Rhodococcus kyotonensis]
MAPGVYSFDHDHAVPARELGELLGGKGAGLAEMTAALGFSVPPGFTISLPVCREYLATGWPTNLDDELDRHVRRLGDLMGRQLGDAEDPLLVAVRSGAPVSMPGMLDTVLNLGLNDDTVEGLARRSGDEWFAWDSYRRFVTMYATTVMGVDADALPRNDLPADAPGLRAAVVSLKSAVEALAGRPVPHDPVQQLREAIEAVFLSWGSDRARAYRAHESIDGDLGTGCNVQAMVFGNRGPSSGTGVVFTRNPATGEARPYGDYLPKAQGEDVVAGSARTMPIASMAEYQPEAYAALTAALRKLEVHYRDICDVEFTVEEGKLWLLQTRIGKRGAVAAVRIAVDLTSDPDVALTVDEALARVSPTLRAKARTEIASRSGTSGHDDDLLATGLGASPGRVTGRVVLSAEDAICADDDVVLVRTCTSPEDVAGMAASVGILTTKGGLVSHAAVVARGWGVPAVVGADTLTIVGDEIRSTDGMIVRAGDVVTIDGASGAVWRGEVAHTDSVDDLVADELPHLLRIEKWALEHEVSPA